MTQRNDKPFFISSKEDCKYCRLAKTAMQQRNIGYIESVLNDDGLRTLKEKGYTTVPQIWHGDVHVGGFEALVKYLDQHFPE